MSAARARARRFARRGWWALPPRVRDPLRVLLYRVRGARSRPASPPAVARRAARPPRATPATTVSVVIPTRDGGPLFERVLASVRAQEGLGTLELVVLDSRSADATRERAAAAEATVVDVPPGSFGHGRTRNVGAELARGEVLVMMTQDALLLGRHALAELCAELLEDPRRAAVSARHVPRSDADLFAAYGLFAHAQLGHATLRARAEVDDVCAAIRREAWEELRFRDLPFAEDLDFGLRALDAGWTVSRSTVATIAHSHTRDAVYALRRGAADRLWVARLLDDEARVAGAEHPVEAILAGGKELVRALAGAAETVREQELPLETALRALRGSLERAGDPSAWRGLAELDGFLADGHAGATRAAATLRSELRTAMLWPPLTAFARRQPRVPRADAVDLVAKLAASVIGAAAGESARRTGDETSASRLLTGV
jgi:rhamnosyltransferase